MLRTFLAFFKSPNRVFSSTYCRPRWLCGSQARPHTSVTRSDEPGSSPRCPVIDSMSPLGFPADLFEKCAGQRPDFVDDGQAEDDSAT
jgi:hypothetical protein